MIKSLASIIIASSVGVASAPASTVSVICGTTFNVDTIEHYKAGPGMTYTLLQYTTADESRTFRSHVLTADTQGENAPAIRAGLARDSVYGTERISSIAKRKDSPTRQYLGGINSDFFVTSSFANDLKNAGFPNMLGNPNSNCAVDSRIVAGNAPITDGAHKYGHFVVGENANEMWCDVAVVSNVLNIKGVLTSMPSLQPWVNVAPRNADVVVFNSAMGKYTCNPAGVTEIQAELIEGSEWGINKAVRFRVTGEASTKGNMAIPANGLVIAAGPGIPEKAVKALANFTPGTEFTYSTTVKLEDYNVRPKATAMACGDVVLLYRGEVRQAGIATDRYINVRTTKYPHTMAGYSEDRSKAVFCVVDGTTKRPTAGCTYPEGAEMMRSYGCYDAVNFDGGGSSAMYLQKHGIVNTPCDGAERAVCSGLYMTVDAPADNTVSEIRFKDWAKTIDPDGEYTPVFYGYNSYGILVDTDVKGVVLNCPDALGSITTDGTTLMATGSGTHALTAAKDGMTAAIAVTIGGSAGITDIAADGSSTDETAEWYNMCGVRIDPATASPGIYLRRQGGKTDKIIL